LDCEQAQEDDFFQKFDLLSNDGSLHVKFFDLGFSDLADKNGFGSNSNSGTPLYSSPEQLRGDFQTHNSDIYSIGCILYQLLTGRRPFSGESRAEIIESQKRKIRASEFKPPISSQNFQLIK
jgi:serine/threonine protein kinase